MTRELPFSSGNPTIEETRGIMHLFRDDVVSSVSKLPMSFLPLFRLIFQQLLQQERQHNADALDSRKKHLEDCENLHSQLQECSFKFEEITSNADSSTMDNVLELLTKFESQITQVFAERGRKEGLRGTIPNW